MKKYGASVLMAFPLLVGAAAANVAPDGTMTSGHGMTSNGGMTVDGSLQRSHGDWRSSKLVGATVYNSQGSSIGTIDDLLLGAGRWQRWSRCRSAS